MSLSSIGGPLLYDNRNTMGQTGWLFTWLPPIMAQTGWLFTWLPPIMGQTAWLFTVSSWHGLWKNQSETCRLHLISTVNTGLLYHERLWLLYSCLNACKHIMSTVGSCMSIIHWWVLLKSIETRAVCKTCMPHIWAVRCTGSHCVNTTFVTVTLTFDLVTWKSIGVICKSRSMYLWSVMILGKSVLELSFENHLTISGHCDLDLVTSKSIGVICESWSIYLWSFMILGICFLELSSENHFTISGHRDLDLWPSDIKINRGHLRVMINLPMKFHDPSRMRSWVIIRKPFYYFGSPWPWPLT